MEEIGGELRIRVFQDGDVGPVTALWRDVFPGELPHNAPEIVIPEKRAFQPELLFVAALDGVVVGTLMAGYDGHRGWHYLVAVAPRVRLRGIGTALLRRAEMTLAALGCTKVNLQVRSTNAGVIAFYERAGYVVEDRVSMGRRLAGAGG